MLGWVGWGLGSGVGGRWGWWSGRCGGPGGRRSAVGSSRGLVSRGCRPRRGLGCCPRSSAPPSAAGTMWSLWRAGASHQGVRHSPWSRRLRYAASPSVARRCLVDIATRLPVGSAYNRRTQAWTSSVARAMASRAIWAGTGPHPGMVAGSWPAPSRLVSEMTTSTVTGTDAATALAGEALDQEVGHQLAPRPRVASGTEPVGLLAEGDVGGDGLDHRQQPGEVGHRVRCGS